jgi:integrase
VKREAQKRPRKGKSSNASIGDSGRKSEIRQSRSTADYADFTDTEANALTWADVDFEKNALTVTGGVGGTKNYECRTVPMTDALHALLLRLRDERSPQPSDTISQIDSAKRCIATACRSLGYPHFTRHDFRHFFPTTCIESGVDIPTVSRWLGHKDGGALAMRVYGHLRDEHSFSMVKTVTF